MCACYGVHVYVYMCICTGMLVERKKFITACNIQEKYTLFDNSPHIIDACTVMSGVRCCVLMGYVLSSCAEVCFPSIQYLLLCQLNML